MRAIVDRGCQSAMPMLPSFLISDFLFILSRPFEFFVCFVTRGRVGDVGQTPK
jgi:hypothetical protein